MHERRISRLVCVKLYMELSNTAIVIEMCNAVSFFTDLHQGHNWEENNFEKKNCVSPEGSWAIIWSTGKTTVINFTFFSTKFQWLQWPKLRGRGTTIYGYIGMCCRIWYHFTTINWYKKIIFIKICTLPYALAVI